MQKKRMLITGISGLLGNNLAYFLRNSYDIVGVYHTHKIELDGMKTVPVDLTSDESVRKIINEFEPEIIIHCAAQADVDICEEYPEEAQRINVFGTRNLIENLNGSDPKFVYISTDLVYDGSKKSFSEGDPVKPLNHYGMTKCEAEKESLKKKDALVLRTNFFGWNVQSKYSLGEWVIHELMQKKEIYGFTDCRFSSIYTFEFAKLLDLAIKKNLSGIYNCASSTSMSKYDFVSEIAHQLNLRRDLIKPVSIDDFGFKARRSKQLSLNTSKLAKDLSIEIPSIAYSIGRFVEDFKKGIPNKIKSNRSHYAIYPSGLDIIPYGRQCIDDEDIHAVVEVLKSDSITQGPKIHEFEAALCQLTDAPFCLVVNSGTSALHAACLTAEIKQGDEVITSPNTFVASANCVVYCGGTPVFADIDPETYNISVKEIEKKINKRTKAVIPVHFAGQSCDMEAIQDCVRLYEKKFDHKIYIIEDACHALGSFYKQTRVGSCVYSDITVMSFHPVKNITTGEGGAIFTNDKKLRRKLSYFRSHGITSDFDEFMYKENAVDQAKHSGDKPLINPWYYEQNCLGFNYRMTEIQCALGISQLKKLNDFRKRRREIVDLYNDAFKNVEWLKTPLERDYCHSNFHLYVLQFDFEKIKKSRAQVMLELKNKGIQTQVHYIPLYRQPFYKEHFQARAGDYPHTEQYYRRCLSIPLYPVMVKGEINKVIKSIKEIAE